MKKIFFYIISILDHLFLKNGKKIVYTSFPDFTDNSFAMFIYMSNLHPEYHSIWLIDDLKKIDLYKKMTFNYTKNESYTIAKKNSLTGLYSYLTSKYVFFSHGLYTGVKIPNNHVVTNLWHGMPLKSIGYIDKAYKGTVQKSQYNIATSNFYQSIIAKAFDANIDKVLITGQPRNDFLTQTKSNILQEFGITDNYTNIFMWMPTYRTSIIGDIRIDGADKDSLPLMSIKDIDDINSELKALNSFMFIKLHPMDILTRKKFKSYTNISILTNDDFERKGIQLYTLLGNIDVLLTDYSSVYIDYLLKNKPIAFVMEDIEAFSNSRGFVFDTPLNYMPGQLITTKENFVKFLKNPIIKQVDEQLKLKFNSVDQKPCETIFSKIIKS